ncbi:hypothetical protein [Pseudonocardia endophytica]|uniref:Uncharacterized protein n=1 Tax=Pseudonocardia endophytica TaxID=401976 RepID=A0A4R1HNH6_PSEEN|nr:hypothetical protein [Pseudonocardia endophytica]TCK21229.1 hypothetical protein EV378_5209 [Pseudonocardia endophytica]
MAENTNKRSVRRRVSAATAATAVALGIGLATAGAAYANDEIPPPMTQPGQENPSTSIQPAGSPSNPATPDMDAIHQDIMP